MSYTPSYNNGDFKAVCDSCGRIYKASELKLRWDGLRVCSDDFEQRQPQDFVRGIKDEQAPPWTRPESSDTFVGGICTPETSAGVAGYGTAGCAIAGRPFPTWFTGLPQSTFNQS